MTFPKTLKQGKIGGKKDIQNITTDEKLQNKIEQFKSLDDKVKHCDDSMQELVSTLQELSKSLANIPIEKRDKALERLENIFCTDKDALQSKKLYTYNAVHPFVYKIHTQ